MKKISLLLGLAFLLGNSGIAQKNETGRATNMPVKQSAIKAVTNTLSTVPLELKKGGSKGYMTESFEGTFPPTGWTKQNPDGGTGWAQQANGTTPLPGWGGGTQTVPTGGGNYVAYCTYTTGGSSDNDQWLISPQFAVTSGDQLKFNLWWFGSYEDSVFVLLSTTTNAMSSFTTTLLAVDTNDLMPMGTWINYSFDLSAYAGQSIYVAFREKVSDNYTMGAYIALDLFSMGTPPSNDAGVTSISKPVSGCTLTSAEDVEVTIMNYGGNAISNFPVAYTINGGAPVTATISQTLNSGATTTYTFTGAQAADLSAPGSYTINAYTSLAGDADNTNDDATITVNSGAATVPYSMGFEAGEDLSGWYVQDVNQDGYTWGLYADNTLSHGGDNFAAYSYNSASDADDWLISTCIHLDASKTYNVSFWYRIQDDTYPEKMKFFIGTDTSVSSMTTQIEDYGTLTNMTYVQSVNIVNVPSTGTYHFGWYCYSDADMWDLLIDDILIEEQVGINEFSNTIFSVYPNPAKDMLNISASENITNMKLVNVFGQVVLAKEVNGKVSSVNTSNIADGIYYLQIETKNGLTTKSVAINK